MSKKEPNGCKICEAISDSTRVKILQFLIRKYPSAQTITDIEKSLEKPVSATTISFHLRKLRDSGLVTTNGHKKGFRALHKALSIKIDDNGLHVEKEGREVKNG
ncbi:MAG: winged helix-turn-helix domain-containing protein [Candidatus Bathyarchaeia archaeon]